MPDLSALLVNLGATLAAALVVVLIAFVIGVVGGKHRIIDVFWGLGFAAVGLTGLAPLGRPRRPDAPVPGGGTHRGVGPPTRRPHWMARPR